MCIVKDVLHNQYATFLICEITEQFQVKLLLNFVPSIYINKYSSMKRICKEILELQSRKPFSGDYLKFWLYNWLINILYVLLSYLFASIYL